MIAGWRDRLRRHIVILQFGDGEQQLTPVAH